MPDAVTHRVDDALESCPFCGSTVLANMGDYVHCEICGADGPYAEQSTVVWNTRVEAAGVAELREENERLREKLKLKIVPADPIVFEDVTNQGKAQADE